MTSDSRFTHCAADPHTPPHTHTHNSEDIEDACVATAAALKPILATMPISDCMPNWSQLPLEKLDPIAWAVLTSGPSQPKWANSVQGHELCCLLIGLAHATWTFLRTSTSSHLESHLITHAHAAGQLASQALSGPHS